MYIYILLAVVLSILCRYKKRTWPLVVSLILLLIVGGFRAETVGTDTKNYAELFNVFGEAGELIHANELGYVLLQLGILMLGGSARTVIFFTQFIPLLILFFYSKKVSKRPQYVVLCYLLLYFYLYSFNIARQFMAIPFVLFGYYYFDIRKTWIGLIWIFCGVLFHYMALVGIVPVVFRYFKWRSSGQVFLLIISLLLGYTVFPQMVLNEIQSLFRSFSLYITDTSEYRLLNFSISRMLLTLFAIILVSVLKSDTNRLKILTLGVCLINILAFHPVIARVAQFFTCIQIAIIPEIPMLIKGSYRHNLRLIQVVANVYMVVVFCYLLITNVGEVVPYAFGGFSIT